MKDVYGGYRERFARASTHSPRRAIRPPNYVRDDSAYHPPESGIDDTNKSSPWRSKS